MPSIHRPRPSLTLESLDYDVFQLIASELLCTHKGSLRQLASTSHCIRRFVLPKLFQRCATDYRGKLGIPPPTICPFVQYLTYTGYANPKETEQCALEIKFFPALHSVIFDGVGRGVPWRVFQRCLSLPNVTSITFSEEAPFRYIKPYSAKKIATASVSLTTLSCRPNPWRMLIDPLNVLQRPAEPFSYQDELNVEARSLPPLVLRMSETAESLVLPMETAPLASMAMLSWPNLRNFELNGTCLQTSQLDALCHLLSHMPRLTHITLLIARPVSVGRISILGRNHSESRCNPIDSLQLRSLTLAYPDPDDAIFSLDFTHLSHLSLCDHPRYYYHLVSTNVSRRWSAPILSSTECLFILRRMGTMEHLMSLEIVYETGDDDDELLRHIASAYPVLSNLKMYRYREDRTEAVDHSHIAHLLGSARTLRTVYLHLDFPDDSGLFCDDYAEHDRWVPICDRRGRELAEVFEACPVLEFVALLWSGKNYSWWMEYHPQRCAEPRLRRGYRDSLPVPWGLRR